MQNALDSPAPLRDVAGRLRWWARDGAGRAWGAAGWLTPVEAGPGARLPVATRPRRHRDRGAHGKPGRWPQRHPRRRCRARERPDPVTRDRASGHRHPQCPVRTCCGHRSTGTVAPHPNLPSQPAGRRLAELAGPRSRTNPPCRHGAPSLPGARSWTGQNGSKPHATACGAAGERIPGGAEAPGWHQGPFVPQTGRCSVLRAAACARQCGRRHPRSPGLGTAVRRG